VWCLGENAEEERREIIQKKEKGKEGKNKREVGEKENFSHSPVRPPLGEKITV
jgi:hypothetical protein